MKPSFPWWIAVMAVTAAAPGPPAPRELSLCDAPGNQSNPVLAADGRGGAFVAWGDTRSQQFDVYAQHLLPSRRLDPAWPAEGRPLCDVRDDQAGPAIVADGQGGAIAAWWDQRGGKDHDLYAQRLSARATLWTKDGVALCTAPGHQQAPTAVSDGAGGAIVAWFDHRAGADAHIYAQHVLASGTVDSLWPRDGVPLCMAAGAQYFPKAISDGAGGAIVTWYDKRPGPTYDIYAQRVLRSGAVDPRWPADGRALCTARNDQRNPVIVPDGSGGALVAWEDGREGPKGDVYAQHVLAAGQVDPAWPDDGRAVCAAPSGQHYLAAASDGRGGMVVAWEDDRDGDTKIFAHHLLGSGSLDPRWPGDGLKLAAADGRQSEPALEADGAGGVVAAWQDSRNGADLDLYWTRIDLGRAKGSAVSHGRPLCTAGGNQVKVALARVAKGAVVAAWEDWRGGPSSDLRAAWIQAPATSGTRRTSSRGSAR